MFSLHHNLLLSQLSVSYSAHPLQTSPWRVESMCSFPIRLPSFFAPFPPIWAPTTHHHLSLSISILLARIGLANPHSWMKSSSWHPVCTQAIEVSWRESATLPWMIFQLHDTKHWFRQATQQPFCISLSYSSSPTFYKASCIHSLTPSPSMYRIPMLATCGSWVITVARHVSPSPQSPVQKTETEA